MPLKKIDKLKIETIVQDKKIDPALFWSVFTEYDKLMELYKINLEQQKLDLYSAYLEFSDSFKEIDFSKFMANVKNIARERKMIYSEVLSLFENNDMQNQSNLKDICLSLSMSMKSNNSIQTYLQHDNLAYEYKKKINLLEERIKESLAIDFSEIVNQGDSRHKLLDHTLRINTCIDFVEKKIGLKSNGWPLSFIFFIREFEEELFQYIRKNTSRVDKKNDEAPQPKKKDITNSFKDHPPVNCEELIKTKVERNHSVTVDEFNEIIDKHFQGIVGLTEIKDELKKRVALYNFTIQKRPYNILLTGNPGTGKTTAAKIICKVLYECGVIENSRFCGITAADLQGQYVGQTIPKIQKIFEQTRGGVIFLDEVYSLATNTAFTHDAVNELLLQLEAEKNKNTVVIAAGYKDKINQFFNANPGLKSRFSGSIHLKDYSLEQLSAIACNAIEEQGFEIDEETRFHLEEKFKNDITKENFGNARYAVKVAEALVANSSQRLWTEGEYSNIVVTQEDVDNCYESRLMNETESKRKIGF